MVKLKACKNACIKARSATSSYGESIENADSYYYNTLKHKVQFFLTKGEWCCSLSFYPKSLILGKLGILFYFKCFSFSESTCFMLL